MIDVVLQVLSAFAGMLIGALPTLASLALGFTVLSVLFTPCNPGAPWWRKEDLATDLVFFFLLPFAGRAATLVFLLLTIGVGLAVTGEIHLVGSFGSNGGLLSALPFWLQVIVYLILADVMLYWSHRIFHTASLWRFHAIHHAPEHLDWISARRFHPVDTALHSVLPDFVLLLLGIPPEVILLVAPFNVWHSALVHANLDWTFGPFKYVLAGPVFHRWHHTDVERGGSMNFAATFPVIDVIFGTFYMPVGVLPDQYGVDDPKFPSSVKEQLLYPFIKTDTDGEATAAKAQPVS